MSQKFSRVSTHSKPPKLKLVKKSQASKPDSPTASTPSSTLQESSAPSAEPPRQAEVSSILGPEPKAVPFEQIANGIRQEQEKEKRNKGGRPTKEQIAAREAAARAALQPPPSEIKIPAEAIEMYLKLPFQMASTQTGFSGWELEDKAAKELVPVTQKAIQELMPVMNTRYGATYALCASLIGMSVMRYTMYVDWKKGQGRDLSTINRTDPAAARDAPVSAESPTIN